ncbi:MAG: hypothetical protein JWN30_1991 [Bacilli bacterium]|nr:hypothetical protein [Bacilli bacterium]
MAVSVTTTLPAIVNVGVPQSFQVCATTDGHVGEPVTGLATLSNPSQANQFALFFIPPEGQPQRINFNASGQAGPSPVFPLMNACANFQVTFNAAGAYGYTLQLISQVTGQVLTTLSSTEFVFQAPPAYV